SAETPPDCLTGHAYQKGSPARPGGGQVPCVCRGAMQPIKPRPPPASLRRALEAHRERGVPFGRMELVRRRCVSPLFLRLDRHLQRLDPELDVGVVVQVRPAGRATVLTGYAGDQVNRQLDFLVRRQVAPVQDQLPAPRLEVTDQAALRAVVPQPGVLL